MARKSKKQSIKPEVVLELKEALTKANVEYKGESLINKDSFKGDRVYFSPVVPELITKTSKGDPTTIFDEAVKKGEGTEVLVDWYEECEKTKEMLRIVSMNYEEEIKQLKKEISNTLAAKLRDLYLSIQPFKSLLDKHSNKSWLERAFTGVTLFLELKDKLISISTNMSELISELQNDYEELNINPFSSQADGI